METQNQDKLRASLQATLDQILAEPDPKKRERKLEYFKLKNKALVPDIFELLKKAPEKHQAEEPKEVSKIEEPKAEEGKKLFDNSYAKEFQSFCLKMAAKVAQEKSKDLDPNNPDDAREIKLLQIKEQKKAELVGQVSIAEMEDFLPRELAEEDILTTKFPEPKYAVPGILPEGAILFGGRPKDGKSWLIHVLFAAITHGRKALDRFDCPPGDVLYFCLEDPHVLVQDRVRTMLAKIPKNESGDQGSVKNMKIVFRVDSIEQLMDDTATWYAKAKNPKLVVIDTLASIMPDSYDNDNFKDSYRIIKGFREWAKQNHVAVIVVHHTSTKGRNGDPIGEIMGSTGLIAAPETVWVLHRVKSKRVLYMTSKFYGKEESYVLDYKEKGYWRILGTFEEENLSPERKKILDILKEKPMSIKNVSAILGLDYNNTKQFFYQLSKDGKIEKDDNGDFCVLD